tara:strand:+ start:155 stop:568 length:414 start_codon:yes stop_codon:yes gene_type:complete
MQKIFLIGLIISSFELLNAAEMSLDISEKINISSEAIEIQEGKIEFLNNVTFQSKSYEISGEEAEYDRNKDLIKIKGSPVKFKISTNSSNFEGSSNIVLIKENEVEISGRVLIEDKSSIIRGELIIFNFNSGKLEIN